MKIDNKNYRNKWKINKKKISIYIAYIKLINVVCVFLFLFLSITVSDDGVGDGDGLFWKNASISIKEGLHLEIETTNLYRR